MESKPTYTSSSFSQGNLDIGIKISSRLGSEAISARSSPARLASGCNHSSGRGARCSSSSGSCPVTHSVGKTSVDNGLANRDLNDKHLSQSHRRRKCQTRRLRQQTRWLSDIVRFPAKLQNFAIFRCTQRREGIARGERVPSKEGGIIVTEEVSKKKR